METYVYSDKSGYYWYSLPHERFESLPVELTIDGQVFSKKQEFHMTIINGRGVAKTLAQGDATKIPVLEEEITQLLEAYNAATPISFDTFIPDVRKASEPGRSSILVRCTAHNLEGFFAALNERFSSAIPVQPPHVSLYTTSDRGVGIDSTNHMESLEKISVPEIDAFLSAH